MSDVTVYVDMDFEFRNIDHGTVQELLDHIAKVYASTPEVHWDSLQVKQASDYDTGYEPKLEFYYTRPFNYEERVRIEAMRLQGQQHDANREREMYQRLKAKYEGAT